MNLCTDYKKLCFLVCFFTIAPPSKVFDVEIWDFWPDTAKSLKFPLKFVKERNRYYDPPKTPPKVVGVTLTQPRWGDFDCVSGGYFDTFFDFKHLAFSNLRT